MFRAWWEEAENWSVTAYLLKLFPVSHQLLLCGLRESPLPTGIYFFFVVVTGNEDLPKRFQRSTGQISTGIGTLVLMGMGNLAAITSKLIEHGRAPETPVALIRWGTRPEQQTWLGTWGISPAWLWRRVQNPAVIVR